MRTRTLQGSNTQKQTQTQIWRYIHWVHVGPTSTIPLDKRCTRYEVPLTTRINALLGTVKRFIAPDLRPQHSCRHALVLTRIEQALMGHEGTFINFTDHTYQLCIIMISIHMRANPFAFGYSICWSIIQNCFELIVNWNRCTFDLRPCVAELPSMLTWTEQTLPPLGTFINHRYPWSIIIPIFVPIALDLARICVELLFNLWLECITDQHKYSCQAEIWNYLTDIPLKNNS